MPNDILGRRTNVDYTGVAFGSPTPPIGQPFGYNDRNELISSSRGGTSWTYDYDPIGNRKTYDKTGQPTTTYTRNALNQYTLTRVPTTPIPLHQSYAFDADGNLAQTWAAGDMNCDGLVEVGDVNAFQAALLGRAYYESQYPNCNWLVSVL